MTDNKRSFVDQFAARSKELLKKKGGFADKYAKQDSESSSGNQDDSSEGGSESKFSEVLNKTEEKKPFSEAKSVMRKSKSINKENFADAARKSRLDCVFLVRGKDRGRSAWHYVLVDKSKREMFLAKSRTGSIDVALYGEILYSGWGEDPPENIVKKIEDEFGL